MFVTICVIVFFSLFSSQVFKLKKVEVAFFGVNNKPIDNIQQNRVYNTYDKVNNIITTTNFGYGNLVFLINTNNYASTLELKNPYLKLKNIEIKFPNKLVINATERTPLFFISNPNNYFLLDCDYKLLEITKNKLQTSNLVELKTVASSGEVVKFFTFFNILPSVYEAGQSLKENNKILQTLVDMPIILQNYTTDNLTKYFSEINFCEVNNTINLKIQATYPSTLSLVVEDVFVNFNNKLNKLLNALTTLKHKEPVKATFGILKIDENLNCSWNNL